MQCIRVHLCAVVYRSNYNESADGIQQKRIIFARFLPKEM